MTGTLAAALLLADGRTPTGSYAHSCGLEAAVHAGLTPVDVPAFIRGRLRSVALTDAALSASAVRAARDEDHDALLALDDEALARCPSPPLRAASAALGRGVLRTGAQLYPADEMLRGYRATSTATPRSVAFGVVAAAGSLTASAAALVALHDDAASVAAAAVKLLPIDAGAASGWIAELAGELEQLAAEAALDVRPPSFAAPLIEARSLIHTTDRGRLFAS